MHLIFDRVPNHYYKISTPEQSFLITENPTDTNIMEFLQLFQSLNVGFLIRTTQPNYKATIFQTRNIKLIEMEFENGSLPSESQILEFQDIVKQAQAAQKVIAVQGVSGRTRPPLLIACALCEGGWSVENAIHKLRQSIQGQAFSPDQIEFLYQKYERRK
ncbi:Protein tyrosine phosphatase [Spironucleus salmonicida]|uniref:Protein tyrosine phosphatase n=1 Tax=Spironucleus salmonicida TaxID=348837 RepID=V6M2H2_9EUKA|nr:Protein tyrosine phosphatase [Spironucleus salmonicida]|eukprot:EST47449.1 Protein tyrosine phosphatase [Spironucleus salmonicida]